jgi:hypothetical protein
MSIVRFPQKIKKSPFAGKPADNRKSLDRDSRRGTTSANPQSRSILFTCGAETRVLEVAQ